MRILIEEVSRSHIYRLSRHVPLGPIDLLIEIVLVTILRIQVGTINTIRCIFCHIGLMIWKCPAFVGLVDHDTIQLMLDLVPLQDDLLEQIIIPDSFCFFEDLFSLFSLETTVIENQLCLVTRTWLVIWIKLFHQHLIGPKPSEEPLGSFLELPSSILILHPGLLRHMMRFWTEILLHPLFESIEPNILYVKHTILLFMTNVS